MDPRRFDTMTRSLASPTSRRGLFAGLGALLISARASSTQSDCPPGQTRNRKGDCNCPAGTDPCPDGCFNRKTDLNNCGKCGWTCLGGTCVKGECRCPAGTVLCDGACVNPATFQTDVDNCGACGTVCGTGDACLISLCQLGVCSIEQLTCDDGNRCTDDCCDSQFGCSHQQITCDDENPCTADTCEPDGGCVHTPISGPACTTSGGAAGTCSNGTCVANPTTTTTTTTAAPTTTTTTSTTTVAPTHELINGATFQICNAGGIDSCNPECIFCSSIVVGTSNALCTGSRRFPAIGITLAHQVWCATSAQRSEECACLRADSAWSPGPVSSCARPGAN